MSDATERPERDPTRAPLRGRRVWTLGILSSLLVGATTPAVAQGPVFAGVPVARLLSGHIETSHVRMPGGLLGGRAVGLVDATLSELLRLLVDFPSYGSLLPLDAVRVVDRSHGRARLSTAGSLPSLGHFDATLAVAIEGHPDGKHTLALTSESATFDALAVHIEARKSPGGVRSMIAIDLGVAVHGASPRRLASSASAISTSVVTRIRRVLREHHRAHPGSP